MLPKLLPSRLTSGVSLGNTARPDAPSVAGRQLARLGNNSGKPTGNNLGNPRSYPSRSLPPPRPLTQPLTASRRASQGAYREARVLPDLVTASGHGKHPGTACPHQMEYGAGTKRLTDRLPQRATGRRRTGQRHGGTDGTRRGRHGGRHHRRWQDIDLRRSATATARLPLRCVTQGFRQLSRPAWSQGTQGFRQPCSATAGDRAAMRRCAMATQAHRVRSRRRAGTAATWFRHGRAMAGRQSPSEDQLPAMAEALADGRTARYGRRPSAP